MSSAESHSYKTCISTNGMMCSLISSISKRCSHQFPLAGKETSLVCASDLQRAQVCD